MTRFGLLLVVLGAAVDCNLLVGVNDLPLAPTDAESDASGYDAAIDGAAGPDASRDGPSEGAMADATIAPDEGPEGGEEQSPSVDDAPGVGIDDAEAGAAPDSSAEGGSDAADAGLVNDSSAVPDEGAADAQPDASDDDAG